MQTVYNNNFDDVAKLIDVDVSYDDIGQKVEEETERKVFCKISEASQKEFFAAHQSGLNPELKIAMWKDDYNGERTCEVAGHRYTVYRTSTYDEQISLYCEARVE